MDSENIINGPPAPLFKNPKQPLGEFLLERLGRHGNAVALVDAATGNKRTFDEIRILSLKLAESMRYGKPETNNCHLAMGDSIAVCSENTINYIIPVLASLSLGASVAPINPAFTREELVHTLLISKPKIIFASKSTLKNMLEVAKDLEFVKLVVLMDQNGPEEMSPQPINGLVKSIFDLINAKKFVPSIPIEKDFPRVDTSENVALIMSSSGTTGLPKGVMLTHLNICTYLNLVEYIKSMEPAETHRTCLALLPFFHAYGLLGIFQTLTLGHKAVVMHAFKPDAFLKAIEEYRISRLALVPPLAVFLSKDPRVEKYDLSSVEEVVCGAAPLSKDTENKVVEIINRHRSRVGAPPCIFRQGYGLTEVTLGVAITPLEGKKLGSVGVLLPGFQCKVADLDTGKALGPNKAGELCFRGAMLMKGYKGNSDATVSIIDEDGWLHSGDIGYYDDDKHLFVVDRIKELIKYKAFQVAPAELEALLLKHPGIKDAAVIGIPDEVAGEVPRAYVVKEKGSKLSQGDIISYIGKHVSSHKQLRGGVQFVDSIPKTASGKILRREFRTKVLSKL
ncbi:luciferin 4-monooxygenase-like [Ischnura elegans]|uniref:luciferin 4-monooxygenase-like n=1 Tax=Ischnura elegans TaxID=197161 RepID=UPI001ED8A8CE|nr:luciferin 4-monooxygenase-like [Ischnura elegans]